MCKRHMSIYLNRQMFSTHQLSHWRAYLMPTLLHIDSSPLYGRSVSRQLTGAFVTEWKSSHPDGTVVYRDLNATQIPPVSAEWVGAAYTPEGARTPQQKALLSLSDSLLDVLIGLLEFGKQAIRSRMQSLL